MTAVNHYSTSELIKHLDNSGRHWYFMYIWVDKSPVPHYDYYLLVETLFNMHVGLNWHLYFRLIGFLNDTGNFFKFNYCNPLLNPWVNQRLWATNANCLFLFLPFSCHHWLSKVTHIVAPVFLHQVTKIILNKKSTDPQFVPDKQYITWTWVFILDLL